ncbi:Methionine biosynthesis protein MetW [Caenispirillum salinarum AK4]|uniref:Methionine biosynthesis protein MetW n=1 Tax=Caenispirillum salinarum AK4 TaxID=1238182 RepID=K9HKS9_9PROT|nr:methionine biosynthesis protein MetW [Caenispirillum salinarum]EKV29146.1 Methionine biosynthesis protein MetW [Caenispirillum salinarum AK4]
MTHIDTANQTVAQAGTVAAAGAPPGANAGIRVDLQLIASLVAPESRVLDVGCEDGTLLSYLWQTKRVDGRGIELSMDGVQAAVAQGLSVIQGDADTDLKDYPAGAFDYAILSQTLQATRNPRGVLEDLLRIGHRAIVSFPNFGYWRNRLHLVTQGRMPVSRCLPSQWWATPNIHLCTIRDFRDLCRELGVTVEAAYALDSQGRKSRLSADGSLANLMAEQALFLLRRK